ncbi:hypothetical protein TD95_003372 [Thielaviopsis punctulata]|uniref:DNA mismatch repair protein MSH5 n=1 Tax=Thielaviopsis punctulata TaxID=72032 RepID=A0A0F4ZKY9_9PEZI|nr:hypothetical protein TD95_003372 [Thielaviopsis punctulata]
MPPARSQRQSYSRSSTSRATQSRTSSRASLASNSQVSSSLKSSSRMRQSAAPLQANPPSQPFRPSSTLSLQSQTAPSVASTAASKDASSRTATSATKNNESQEDEITMAIEMRNDGSLGCAFLSFQEGCLQIMEDISQGDLDLVDQLMVHIEPTIILVPMRNPEELETRLTNYCNERNKAILGEIQHKMDNDPDIIGCAGAVVSDIRRRRESLVISHEVDIAKMSMFTLKDFMFINLDSLIALQIINSEMHPNSLIWGPQNPNTGSKESLSLYGLFQSFAASVPGKLKLRKLFLRPLLDLQLINERQMTISLLIRPENQEIVRTISKALRGVRNIKNTLEQLRKGTDPVTGRGSSDTGIWGAIQKFCLSVINIREAVGRLPGDTIPIVIQRVLEHVHAPSLSAVGQLISRTVNIERCTSVARVIVATGVSPQLDELRRTYDGMESLLNQAAQQMVQSIPGWAREYISNCIFYPQLGFLTVVPLNQELNTPMYSGEGITDDTWEKMFTAEGKVFFKNSPMRELDEQFGDMYSMISDFEIEILHSLSREVLSYESSLLTAANVCGDLDCMVALALGAQKYNWVQPVVTTENVIQIRGGRHPLQELVVPAYIPNDCGLAGGAGAEENHGSPALSDGHEELPTTLVLTGPNHSGKSVYLKHIALIVYLAHVGSFVPADSAVIGITDKILTRIATRESSGQNQSAFSIDLRQIAFSARMATRQSLILVDEFGKGTRADDGAALLAALIDHFVSRGVEAPKMAVATHFHEIIQGGYFDGSPRVALAHMEVQELQETHVGDITQEGILYLYRLCAGASTSSFGALCASLNGVDDAVVQRAEVLMAAMSRNEDLRAVCSEMTHEEQCKFEVAEEVARAFLHLSLQTGGNGVEKRRISARDTIRQLLESVEEAEGMSAEEEMSE